MNKYIKNKGYTIKYDLDSLLLCFDYFNHGIRLPEPIDYILIRKILHFLMRLTIQVAYIFKLYRIKYKIISLPNDALIIFEGKGEWANKVILNKKKDKFILTKFFSNKQVYLKEKNFYNTYLKHSKLIRFPKFKFKNNNSVEMEFIKTKSFQRLINDGTYDFNKAFMHYTNINNELKKFYINKRSLIHNDLSPENILIHENKYYFIDFSDSKINQSVYDSYTLLRSVLYSYNNKNVNRFYKSHALTRRNLASLLDVSIKKIISMEKIFKILDIKKHPEHLLIHKIGEFPGLYYK